MLWSGWTQSISHHKKLYNMDPITMALLPTILKGGVGAIQGIGGLMGMIGNKRPKYRIPGAAVGALGVAKEQASRHEMPGESATLARIKQTGANAVAAAREYGMAGLSALPAIQGSMQSGALQLSAQSAQWRDRKQADYQQALSQFAMYEDQDWQMNKFAPFMDRRQRSQNALGAGIQNIGGGADSALMAMLGMPDLFGTGGNAANVSKIGMMMQEVTNKYGKY